MKQARIRANFTLFCPITLPRGLDLPWSLAIYQFMNRQNKTGRIFHFLMFTGMMSMLFPLAAFGESASEWVDEGYVRSRLVANYEIISFGGEETIFIGWQVELQEGWKTYWRTPGEAGLPPRFDWTGSLNIAEVRPLYPLPERFEIFGIQTYGYEDEVILPILIKPQIAGAPVTIRLSLDYMVCLDICIPYEADFILNIPAGELAKPSRYARAIDQEIQRVPRSGLDSELAGIIIEEIHVRGMPGRQRVTITIDSQFLLSGADVILEADSAFRFDAPQRALVGDGTRARFIIPVGSMREGVDLTGKPGIITVTDGWGGMIEQEIVFQ